MTITRGKKWAASARSWRTATTVVPSRSFSPTRSSMTSTWWRMSRWAVGSSRTRIDAVWATATARNTSCRSPSDSSRASRRRRWLAPTRSIAASIAATSDVTRPAERRLVRQATQRHDLLDGHLERAAGPAPGRPRSSVPRPSGPARRAHRRPARRTRSSAGAPRSGPAATSTCRHRSGRRARSARRRRSTGRCHGGSSRVPMVTETPDADRIRSALTARTRFASGTAGTGRTGRRGGPSRPRPGCRRPAWRRRRRRSAASRRPGRTAG